MAGNQNDILQWDNRLSVGIEGIDNQHKKLLERLNILLDAVAMGRSVQEIKNTIKFLELYVKIHFETEEKYMVKYKYPRFKEHKEQHSDFRETVLDFKKNFEVHGISHNLIEKIQELLWNWYQHHVIHSDQIFGKFLLEQKISQANIVLISACKEIEGYVITLPLLKSKSERQKVLSEIRDLIEKIEKIDDID